MSPATKALYPLRVQETLVDVGDMVTDQQAALIAEGADGRQIVLKCGRDGRVIQVAPPGAVLDRRQMILLVESFENSAAKAAPDSAPDAATASGRNAEAPRKSDNAPPEPAPATGAGLNRRSMLVRSIVTVAAGGGLLGLAGVSGAFDPPEPTRAYPAPEDTAWMHGAELEIAEGINLAVDGAEEFLGAGVDQNGEAILVGRGPDKGFVIRCQLQLDRNRFHSLKEFDVSMDYGFALPALPGEKEAYFGFTPTGIRKDTLWYAFEPATGNYRKLLSKYLPGKRVQRAMRTRDFAVYLYEGYGVRDPGILLHHLPSDDYSWPALSIIDDYGFEDRQYKTINIVQRDSHTAKITAGGTRTYTSSDGSRPEKTYGFFRERWRTKDDEGERTKSSIDHTDLGIDDMVPEGVSDGKIGNVALTTIITSQDDAVTLLGTDIWDMTRQKQGERSRTDVAISLEAEDGTQYRRMFVRSDNNWWDGVRLVEAVALPSRRFALLLREATGESFSAVVLINESGETLSRWWSTKNTVLNSITLGVDNELYATGYVIKEGRRYPHFRRFKA